MDILYGTTMAAIFALCVILLWTARRVLQSSPLTSGELSLTGVQPAIERNDFSADPNFADFARQDYEPEFARIDPNLIDPVALEMMAAQETAIEPGEYPGVTQMLPRDEIQSIETASVRMQPFEAEPIEARPVEVEPMDLHLAVETADNSDSAAQPTAKRGDWIARHLPRGRHHYWLECLLLSISVVVLVQTQRSASRHRVLHSSDQVA
ncbi:MAG: hypothetical protein ACRD28_04545 [Acidobacteriaceae bacterium]